MSFKVLPNNYTLAKIKENMRLCIDIVMQMGKQNEKRLDSMVSMKTQTTLFKANTM